MSGQRLSPALREAVMQRSGGACEYCRTPSRGALMPHEVDHFIAGQHGGEASLENLVLACVQCNRHKGTNLASIDPQTGRREYLFDPRHDRWADHFRLEGWRIVPLTPVGRATARLLKFNAAERESARRKLWEVGRYPG